MKIVTIGKIEEKALRTQIEEYEKKLRSFTKLEIIEVNDEVVPQSNNDLQNSQIKGKEGERTLTRIREQECVILFDLWGGMVDSGRFPEELDQLRTYQTGNLTLVIAGSLGPDENVYDRCSWKRRLSDLTFTHQVTGVFVLEQIYRAFVIQSNNPYHK